MILMTGGTGMLGRDVATCFADAGIAVRLAGRASFDLGDPRGAYEFVRGTGATAVIHLAAETDVELCEREPSRAATANYLATRAIATAAAELDAYLLYTSTSNVFGRENRRFYSELDLPGPVNYYGKAKLMGESAVRSLLPSRSLVIRPGWMIGGGPERDHKFVGRIVGQIRAGAKSLSAVHDRHGTITSAARLAELIVWAVQARHTGLVHFASEGVVSRLDIARAIGEVLGFDGPVRGVSSNEYPTVAPHGESEALVSVLMPTGAGVTKPNSWRDDLDQYLEAFR